MLPLLSGFVLLFSAADHWTTYLCLRAPVAGYEVLEANPIAAWLFAQLGLVEGLLLDTVLTVAALTFLLRTRRVPRGLKTAFLVGVIGGTAYAVHNNLDAIYTLGLSPLG